MNRTCRFVCLSREYWSRRSIRVDARAQAPRCQDPRGDSSLDRAGRALRALNHRRIAGPSIAMPRARSVGQRSSVRALGAPHSYGSARTPIMQLGRPRFALSSTPWPTSRQFYADAGDAENRETVVGNQPTGEADQDRRQGGQPRPLRYVSDGRGRGAPADVPGNFVAYRPVAGAARPASPADGVRNMVLRSDRPQREGCALRTGKLQVPALRAERPTWWRPTGRLRSNILAAAPR